MNSAGLRNSARAWLIFFTYLPSFLGPLRECDAEFRQFTDRIETLFPSE